MLTYQKIAAFKLLRDMIMVDEKIHKNEVVFSQIICDKLKITEKMQLASDDMDRKEAINIIAELKEADKVYIFQLLVDMSFIDWEMTNTEYNLMDIIWKVLGIDMDSHLIDIDKDLKD